ncbi:MAG: hypothetical protein ACHQX3_11205, partial [Nitrospirales bacterium]
DWNRVNDPLFENDSRFALDSKLYVQFYTRPILNGAESDAAGRPIYHDIDCVRIMVPGDKLSIVDRLASDDDKRRFADHYAKYRAGQQVQLIGTPLEQVPWLSRSKLEEYKYFGIHSVEQLADASDSVGQKFPGFHSDKDKAIKFIEEASGTNTRIKELERQLAEMQAKMAAPQQIAPPLPPVPQTPVVAHKGK